MKYKLRPNFFFIVVALIVGSAFFRQIDFQNLTIENPALAAIYGITFIVSILLMLKRPKK